MTAAHYAVESTPGGAVIVRVEANGERVTLLKFYGRSQRHRLRRAARSWFDRYYRDAVPPAREDVPAGERTERVRGWEATW